MSFDPLAAGATMLLIGAAILARWAYTQAQAWLVNERRRAFQQGYDARARGERHGLRPLPMEGATWQTDN
jgi:hypothetical protein